MSTRTRMRVRVRIRVVINNIYIHLIAKSLSYKKEKREKPEICSYKLLKLEKSIWRPIYLLSTPLIQN